ncbi:hypothetical protein SAMD00019534_098590 [Acytostelium subglobosum LB1]|uniref:hypothetical protein n=1 Tax=Acytostelium subglobosum LB1 TaxID=1410327 RepID=UPI000644C60A|nr:hypothetical protein SAMD00019534_098590 [Acytostelium subglobosum LB1]GAM26684.1 hypothetical protein SAMD00019534_098590 [Acytostelium subglobosum LB1]|eukprot:XP_012750345.1 hypothetical protein SAMD00019534_098590 [Acytostelium subglobosum LB1]
MEYTLGHQLENKQIERYARQLITPGVGVVGQQCLLKTRVLVVGAGGLGCPVALYLAGAGIGCIGIVDYDVVEIGNLHRQIGHSERAAASCVAKAKSLAASCMGLNSDITVVAHELTFTSETAMQLVAQYDIVVDASDNVATRYLVNDAAVLSKKPLVSGSALKWDGQITVYNYNNGPCYRCLFPSPPPAETVTRCSDGGVLGPIVGVVGSLQALEVIKIATNNVEGVLSGRLMLYDGLAASFKTVRIRTKQATCVVCGDQPSVTALIDYPQFCSSPYSDKATKVDDRIDASLILTCQEFKQQVLDAQAAHLLLDVRPKQQFDICSLPLSINIPIDDLTKAENINRIEQLVKSADPPLPIYVVCRRGNKSQDATAILRQRLTDAESLAIKHIKDGLLGWSEQVDQAFPIY